MEIIYGSHMRERERGYLTMDTAEQSIIVEWIKDWI